MSKTEQEKANDYLQLFKISEQKYIIGIFESGITFYKQQIRALNIFDALMKTGKITNEKNFTITVIGGGIAGLTFAAAAMKANLKVYLFEKGPNTLHIQEFCSTRKIHPNIYDWPAEDSLETHTDLPILNWQYQTAENVIDLIKKEFEGVRKSAEKHRAGSFTSYFNVDTDTFDIAASSKSNRIEIYGQAENEGVPENISIITDLIIYAIGYGLEKGVTQDNNMSSYWRDTSLKQVDLAKTNYIITGTGDGALLDLFTILIHGFSYELFFEILNQNSKGEQLLADLRKIRRKRLTAKKLDDDFYKVEFTALQPSSYKFIFDEFKNRNLFSKLNKDVFLYLSGFETRFTDILKYRKISMLNAFLAFILHKYSKFTYAKKINPEKPIHNKKIIENYKIIRREGTNRGELLKKAKFTFTEYRKLAELKSKQHDSAKNGIVSARWKKEDFNGYFNQRNNIVHHVSKTSKAYFSQFVNLLGASLSQHKNVSFRITLHRVFKINKDVFYQMLSPYYKNLDMSKSDDVGTCYNMNQGNCGYSINSGLPLWVKNIDKKSFAELMNNLSITKNYNLKKSPKSLLSIPILAKFKDTSKKKANLDYRCNAVLYIDSQDINFFDDLEIQKMITKLTKEFIHSLNLSLEKEDINMELNNVVPIQCSNVSNLSSPCIMELATFKEFIPSSSSDPILVRQFSSLEIINA